MWWISLAVKHLRCTSGIASCSLRIDVDVVVEADVRVLAADHVDLGEARELALRERVLDHLRRRVRVGVAPASA